MLGLQLVTLFGEAWEVWPCWRKSVNGGFETLNAFIIAVSLLSPLSSRCELAGEIAQWLKALAFILGDPDSIPSNHMVFHSNL